MVLAVGLIGSNSLLMGPIAPGISKDLFVPVEEVLYASAGFGLGTGFSALFLARWIDRFGLVYILRAAFCILFLALLSSTFSPVLPMLIIAQCVAGLASGLALPAIYAFSAKVAPKGSESRVLGRVLSGWTISLVIGVSISAVLADQVHWRLVYALLSLIAGLLFVAFMLMQNDHANSNVAPSPIEALRIPGVCKLLFLVSCYMIAFYGTYAFVGDHIVGALGQSLSANAVLSVSYGVGFGMASLIGGFIDKAGAAKATPWLFAGLSFVYLAISFLSGNYWSMMGVAFFWGVLNHLVINALIARLSAIDPARRGTVLGLYSGFTYICMFAATLLFGWIYSQSTWPFLAAIAALLCFGSALVAWFSARETQ